MLDGSSADDPVIIPRPKELIIILNDKSFDFKDAITILLSDEDVMLFCFYLFFSDRFL